MEELNNFLSPCKEVDFTSTEIVVRGIRPRGSYQDFVNKQGKTYKISYHQLNDEKFLIRVVLKGYCHCGDSCIFTSLLRDHINKYRVKGVHSSIRPDYSFNTITLALNEYGEVYKYHSWPDTPIESLDTFSVVCYTERFISELEFIQETLILNGFDLEFDSEEEINTKIRIESFTKDKIDLFLHYLLVSILSGFLSILIYEFIC